MTIHNKCHWYATFHNSTLDDWGICHSGRTERMPPCCVRWNDVLASGSSRWEALENAVCQIRNFAASSEYNQPCAVRHCHRAEAHHRQEDRDTFCSYKMRIILGFPSERNFQVGHHNELRQLRFCCAYASNRTTVNPRALFFIYQEHLKFQRVYRS
jgi:hypothetical protein